MFLLTVAVFLKMYSSFFAEKVQNNVYSKLKEVYLYCYHTYPYLGLVKTEFSGAPSENIVQNHLDIALLNVF